MRPTQVENGPPFTFSENRFAYLTGKTVNQWAKVTSGPNLFDFPNKFRWSGVGVTIANNWKMHFKFNICICK
jgi:hypothetical protein